MSEPVESQAFLMTIFGAEVTDHGPGGVLVIDPFRVQVGYTYWDGDLSTFPIWPGIPVGHGLVSTAFGPFQITHTTWRWWKDIAGAPQDMEPLSQCELAWLGAKAVYHTETGGRDLLADLQDPGLHGNVGSALLATWPAGASKFSKRYPLYLKMVQAPPPIPPAPPPVLPTTIDVSGT